MQFGEIVANLCATVFLLSLAAIVFLLFEKPIWPERMDLMVIVLPADAMQTGAVKTMHLICHTVLMSKSLSRDRLAADGDFHGRWQ
ncbi:hypothetical protein [Mesorhizobium sp. LNHC221B00]|uniref:hypothetical protein n=1 Tax=Mesorhizobium sp. LNHC221B00 TaxID=1287233 RepID=UPI0012EBFE6C|nr:hypothetical protein [Mesorhizobium sp. LNHC221B00]